jgi:hypothetical protein
MDRTPTHEDAKLILHLYELRREPRMREARDWIARNFRVKTLAEFQTVCAPGTDGNSFYRMVTTYWEMAASFVASGALHPELFYESSQELLFVWERIRELLPQLREQYKNPMSLKNIERVAGSFIEWWDARAPGAHAAFVARINQIPPTPQKG